MRRVLSLMVSDLIVDMMIDYLTMARWSPYIVGAGIGVLSWAVFLLSDTPLGCSTAYANMAGIVESALSRGKTNGMRYYQKFIPAVDWHWMLVVGIIIGAFFSALLSNTIMVRAVPLIFAAEFGASPLLRFAVAFLGGVLLGLGARWAGGCTSGHGISGTLQLSVSSWVAVFCFFAGGILIAGLLFGFSFL